jgi:GT2 family glycosyltransferase
MSPVTAIVVAFDSAHALPECLGALTADGVPVLVVDNASTDDTAALAEGQGARVIRNPRNEGYGRANNIGARAAGTEFLLVVNPDCTVEKGAVAALVEAARRYPDAGLFAPRIVEPSGRVFYQPRSLLSPYLHNPKGRLVLPEGEACAPFFSGACFLVRRSLFLGLGGFDENIFLFYEDDDLCRRVADAGHALIYVPQATVRQAGAGRANRSGDASSPPAGTRPGRGPM